MTDSFRKTVHANHIVLWNTNIKMRNALTPEYYEGMIRELRNASEDPSVAAVVLAGEGDFFCSGGNLNRLAKRREETAEQRSAGINKLHDVIRAIHECPKPVISAVEGGAAGAGLSIALICDMVVSAQDAKFTLAYVRAGLVPDGGITHTLMQNLPRATAARMALLGDPISAERLYALGMITELVAPGAAVEQAQALAERLGKGPMHAIAKIKSMMDGAKQSSLHEQLEVERVALSEALIGDEAQEGIKAFFEKRPPNFPKPD